MAHRIEIHGQSRSFPTGDPFLDNEGDAEADVVILLGNEVGNSIEAARGARAIVIELDQECLGVYTGEQAGREGSEVLGFARYRNGDDPPSNLIELVRQPQSAPEAIEAAQGAFEAAGFDVSVCSDQAGRIVDRLVRPKYNSALRFLDEGLATAESIDLTCRLGLSYPDGPIERVERGGLARHHDVTRALFDTYGTAGFAPARRAVVAAARRNRK